MPLQCGSPFGISNDYQTTKRVKMGPWYGDGDGSPLSCRQLASCVTEFGAQGLELDAVLLAWGADYVMNAGKMVEPQFIGVPPQEAHSETSAAADYAPRLSHSTCAGARNFRRPPSIDDARSGPASA